MLESDWFITKLLNVPWLDSALYRNTESSVLLLIRWRGDFRIGEYCQIYL